MAVITESMAGRFYRMRCAGFGAIIMESDSRSTRMKRFTIPLFTLFLSVSLVRAQNLAGDMALSLVLIDGEKWEVVASGYQFTDAACADADGNFYFTDVAKGTNIFKVGLDGKVRHVRNTGDTV